MGDARVDPTAVVLAWRSAQLVDSSEPHRRIRRDRRKALEAEMQSVTRGEMVRGAVLLLDTLAHRIALMVGPARLDDRDYPVVDLRAWSVVRDALADTLAQDRGLTSGAVDTVITLATARLDGGDALARFDVECFTEGPPAGETPAPVVMALVQAVNVLSGLVDVLSERTGAGAECVAWLFEG